MSLFITGFWILSVICVVLFLYTRSAVAPISDAAFKSFQRTYLTVYVMAMVTGCRVRSVYALYAHYGMSSHEIEILFVAGFGSSMLCGTIVGSFADKYGRRANCLLYGALYGASCVTKHFNNFWVLMLGRLLGGVATSILYSAFESWLIYEHNKRGFENEALQAVSAHAVLGNSIIAIVCGLVAQQFADFFGFVAPFDVAIAVLTIMCIVIVYTWSENYGDTTSAQMTTFANAFNAIKTDYKILCLGLIQSLFEGSMYTFVLEWTPALTPPASEGHVTRTLLDTSSGKPKIPHGYIFAGFMVAIMIGSSLFKLLNKVTCIESFMRPVLLVASAALLTPILFPGNQLVIFTGFLLFEVCVGIFWPSICTMRGKYVPEATRATIMNFFRVPLNLIVVVILTQNLPMRVIFQCCCVFLAIAAGCQHWLYRLSQGHDAANKVVLKVAPPPDSESLLPEKRPLTGEEQA